TGLGGFGFALIALALFGFLFQAFGYSGGLNWALSARWIVLFWGPPLVVGIMAFWFACRRHGRPTGGSACRAGGYYLGGQIESRCPECGEVFDPAILGRSGSAAGDSRHGLGS